MNAEEMEEMEGQATGDCYEASGNAFVFEEVTQGEGTLVHGRPRLQRPPYCRFGHAWIEASGFCIDVANGSRNVIPRHIYYQAGEIDVKDCFFYSLDEAKRKMVDYGHYGPWDGPFGVDPMKENDVDEDET